MEKFYAQINSQNICLGILRNPPQELIKNNKLIPIDSYNTTLIGRTYIFETNDWADINFQLPSDGIPEPDKDCIIEPTQLDRIEIELIKLQNCFNNSQNDLIDLYTLELIKSNII